MISLPDSFERPNIIIEHGKPTREVYDDLRMPSPSDSHWLPGVAREFVHAGFRVARPDMPEPYAPNNDTWDPELERQDINPRAILMGNSAGAGHQADWLSRHPDVSIGMLVMVKPWLNPNRKYPNFCEAELDPDIPKRCENGVLVVHSLTKDDEQVNRSFDVVYDAFSAHANVVFAPVYDYGQVLSSGLHIFPELAGLVIKKLL